MAEEYIKQERTTGVAKNRAILDQIEEYLEYLSGEGNGTYKVGRGGGGEGAKRSEPANVRAPRYVLNKAIIPQIQSVCQRPFIGVSVELPNLLFRNTGDGGKGGLRQNGRGSEDDGTWDKEW
jgi:hypothetical protein